MCALGDVDGDGKDDFAVGARDPGDGVALPDAGKLVIFDRDSAAPFGKETTRMVAPQMSEGDNFGAGCASRMDLDGDRYDDLAVGASGRHVDAQVDAGAVFLYYSFSPEVAQ